MNNKFYLLLFLIISTSIFADELIIITESNTQTTQINDLIGKDKSKREVDITQNLSSIRVSEFGVDTGVKSIPYQIIAHDISKYPNGSDWYEYYLNTKVAVPFAFTFPNLLGPIGINFGFKPGWEGKFKIISQSRSPNLIKGEELSKLANMKLGAMEGLSAISIPKTSKELLDKYKEGSEIHFDGRGYLTTYTGINVGVPGVSANANVIAIVEGQLKKTLKILENKKEKFIQYRVEKSQTKGHGHSLDLGVGVTLFDTTLPIGSTNFNLKGALRVNLISKTKIKSNKSNLIYDFTYDLNSKAAKSALDNALNGNLIPSQELAITRLNMADYKGVILNEKRTDLIQKTLKDLKYGLRINESSLDSTLSDMYARESLSGFLEIGKTRETVSSEAEKELFYEEKSNIKSFKHSAKDTTKFLFGLVDNNKDLSINTHIIDAEVMSEGQGIGKIQTYKMIFNYSNNHKNGGTKSLKNFLYKSAKSIGHNNSAASSLIKNVNKTNKCSSDSKIKVNATIYKEAFDRFLNYSEAELWSYFGNYLGYGLPVRYRYKEKRNEIYLQLRNLHKKYKDIRVNKYADQKRMIAWQYKLFKKFKGLDFPKRIVQTNKIKDIEKRVKGLHDLISKFEMTDDLLHYLLIISQGDLKGNDKGDGVMAKFQVESSQCEFNWYLDYRPNFSFDDVFSGWL